jgi:hypothetical protein
MGLVVELKVSRSPLDLTPASYLKAQRGADLADFSIGLFEQGAGIRRYPLCLLIVIDRLDADGLSLLNETAAARGLIISVILASQSGTPFCLSLSLPSRPARPKSRQADEPFLPSDILELYRNFVVSILPCLRRRSLHHHPSPRQLNRSRHSSTASIFGTSLSYSNASLNAEPLTFSKPQGSLVGIAGYETKDEPFELEEVHADERETDGSGEGDERDGKRNTLSHGGVHVRVEIERRVEPTWSV